MKITPKQTLDALRTKHADGSKMVLHKCSMCQYPCGYIWNGDRIFYDSGCYCTTSNSTRETEEQDLLDTLEMNKDTGLAERLLSQE